MMIRRTIAAVMVCVGTAASAGAQWVHHPAPGIPRTKDGKPNLTAATPKGADGKPDLSGIWSTDPTPFEEMERLFPFFKAFAVPGDDPRMFTKYFMDVFADVRPRSCSSSGWRRLIPPGRRRPRGVSRPGFRWAIFFHFLAGRSTLPACLRFSTKASTRTA
jgi:hypothetical protein